MEEARAESWIRERLEDENSDEESEEWLELQKDYYNLQEYLAEQAEFEEELQWLHDNGTSLIHRNFISNIDELEEFVASLFADESKVMIYKMSYAYAVTLLESFLGDTLKSLVSKSDKLFKNAISKVDDLKKAKYSLEDLMNNEISVKGLAIMKLSDILFHNIQKVIKTYEAVLGVSIDIEKDEVIEIMKIRHDIVHRNGKTKDGNNIVISEEDIMKMFVSIKIFAEKLQQQINANAA